MAAQRNMLIPLAHAICLVSRTVPEVSWTSSVKPDLHCIITLRSAKKTLDVLVQAPSEWRDVGLEQQPVTFESLIIGVCVWVCVLLQSCSFSHRRTLRRWLIKNDLTAVTSSVLTKKWVCVRFWGWLSFCLFVCLASFFPTNLRGTSQLNFVGK